MAKAKSPRKRTRPGEIPQLLVNKSRNRAFILIDGRRHYCGPVGSEEAENNRLRIWAEHKAAQNVDLDSIASGKVPVAVLVERFLAWAEKNYLKNGRSTGSYDRFCIVVRPLLGLYAETPVNEFGPIALKAVRAIMEKTLSRKVINQRIGLIRYIFRWGVENELVPVAVWQALTAVAGLKQGHTTARETDKVPPVADWVVEKTLPHLPSVVADMVRLQRRTGMRPGELREMRPCDIYRASDIFPDGYEFGDLHGAWVYIPVEHKTEHHGKIRFVVLGPRCQSIVTPYLMDREPEDCVFSPAESVQMRNIERRRTRKSKVQPSQVSRKKENPQFAPGQKYRRDSYRNAIKRGVEKYNKIELAAAEKEGREPKLLPKWFPNQLRHSMATEIRAIGGAEAAQVILGHARLSTTEIYAEKVKKFAIEIAVKHC